MGFYHGFLVVLVLVTAVLIATILRRPKRKHSVSPQFQPESKPTPVGFVRGDGSVREEPWHPREIGSKFGSLSLKEKVEWIQHDLEVKCRAVVSEDFRIVHYGSFDVHPKNLCFWICVQTDAEKQRLEADENLMLTLRESLIRYDYPREGRRLLHIGFESQETVDRKSGGDWIHHWM